MIAAVIGSRSFNCEMTLLTVLAKFNITEIVSGGAKGADSLAEVYADTNNIPCKVFLPDWNKFGKGAGFIRNKDIVDSADIVIAFWDGYSKGTADSLNYARKIGKQIHIEMV